MKKDRLDIVFEDKDLLIINKPAHLLTIGTDKDKINNLYHKVYEYMKKKNKNNKIFIVNRLDKDTSGIVVFARNEKIKKLLQDDWNKLARVRKYVAVVEGNVKKDKDKIVEYLTESKTLQMIRTDSKHGKVAITNYEVVKRSKNYSVLNIFLETGRKNQIRSAMESINHPIIGDSKFGSTKNPVRRMLLHAQTLELIHPITKKVMVFDTKIPKTFDLFINDK